MGTENTSGRLSRWEGIKKLLPRKYRGEALKNTETPYNKERALTRLSESFQIAADYYEALVKYGYEGEDLEPGLTVKTQLVHEIQNSRGKLIGLQSGDMEKFSIPENPSGDKKEADLPAEDLVTRYKIVTKKLMDEFSKQGVLSKGVLLPRDSKTGLRVMVNGQNVYDETYGHQEYHNGQLKIKCAQLGIKFMGEDRTEGPKPQSLRTHYGSIQC
jgi:hypothetical protein